MGKYTVIQDNNNEYYFVLLADNGIRILKSEKYASVSACLNGISSVRKYSQEEEQYEVKLTASGKFYYILKAMNGQVIGNGYFRSDKASVLNDIQVVKKFAITENVVNNTI